MMATLLTPTAAPRRADDTTRGRISRGASPQKGWRPKTIAADYPERQQRWRLLAVIGHVHFEVAMGVVTFADTAPGRPQFETS